MIVLIGVLYRPAIRMVSGGVSLSDYVGGVVTLAGGLAGELLLGFLLIGAMSVVMRRRQPRFAVFTGLLATVFLAISAWTGLNVGLDVLGGPATTQGLVTSHFIQSTKGTATRYIRMGDRTYTVTPAVYQHTESGKCTKLTYGPRTAVATAADPCGT